jgi:hypothetical protein
MLNALLRWLQRNDDLSSVVGDGCACLRIPTEMKWAVAMEMVVGDQAKPRRAEPDLLEFPPPHRSPNRRILRHPAERSSS